MTKSILFGTVLALTVTASSAAEVEFIESANFMLPGCRSFVEHKPDNPDRQGLCLGTIRGLDHEGMLARILLGLARKNGETGSTLEVLRTSLCIDHPGEVHESFTVLALEALQAVWPCK
jgi:hypothetical protein